MFIALTVPYLLYLGRVKNLFGGMAITLRYLFLAIPIVILWCIVVGGQYNVGTDYFSYLRIFSGNGTNFILNRGEYAFTGFIQLCNSIGFYGQDLFFILSLIWILLLLLTFKNLVGLKYVYLLMLVFITFSTAFNNQMNIIRQYTAIYLFTFAFSLLYTKRYTGALVFGILMLLTHSSSIAVILILPLIVFVSRKLTSNKHLILFVSVAAILSFTLNDNVLHLIIGLFDQYAHYLTNGRFEDTSATTKLTKLLYMPLVIYSISMLPKMGLIRSERILFNIGILSYCCKIALLNISIVSRIGAYFEILMCIPLVFLIRHLKNTRQFSKLYLTIAFLLIPYVMKVTAFAVREYDYHSIFFQ